MGTSMILCVSHPLQMFRHGFAMFGDSSAPWVTEKPEVGSQRSEVRGRPSETEKTGFTGSDVSGPDY